jgi:hypothetical protein
MSEARRLWLGVSLIVGWLILMWLASYFNCAC